MLLNIYSLLCLARVFHPRVRGSYQGSACCIYILGSRKEGCNEASRSSISISLARTFYVVNTILRKARSHSLILSSNAQPQHWYSNTKNKEKNAVLMSHGQLTARSWSPMPLWAWRAQAGDPVLLVSQSSSRGREWIQRKPRRGQVYMPVLFPKTRQLGKSQPLLWGGGSTGGKGEPWHSPGVPLPPWERSGNTLMERERGKQAFPASPARRTLSDPIPAL